jgi:hypothetical protein
MVKPADHYHRIETADLSASPTQDVAYYIARLETQLTHLNEITDVKGFVNGFSTELRHHIHQAQGFLQALKDSLDENKIDVA